MAQIVYIPQLHTVPSLVTAKLCCDFVAIIHTRLLMNVSLCCAIRSSCSDPLPSSPVLPLPQEYTLPQPKIREKAMRKESFYSHPLSSSYSFFPCHIYIAGEPDDRPSEQKITVTHIRACAMRLFAVVTASSFTTSVLLGSNLRASSSDCSASAYRF